MLRHTPFKEHFRCRTSPAIDAVVLGSVRVANFSQSIWFIQSIPFSTESHCGLLSFFLGDVLLAQMSKKKKTWAPDDLIIQVYHCLVRYRQLHTLHLQLRREFPGPTLPVFPPKKLFTLTEGQVIASWTSHLKHTFNSQTGWRKEATAREIPSAGVPGPKNLQ